jgi:hypothetical protein
MGAIFAPVARIFAGLAAGILGSEYLKLRFFDPPTVPGTPANVPVQGEIPWWALISLPIGLGIWIFALSGIKFRSNLLKGITFVTGAAGLVWVTLSSGAVYRTEK